MHILTSVALAIVAGCGRVEFNAQPDGTDDDRLRIVENETRVVVTVPGRFELVFDQAFEWQVVGWYDLASDPARDLVGKDDQNPTLRVAQGLLVNADSAWRAATGGSRATMTTERLGPDRVRLSTAWSWITPMRELAASIVHVIDRSGEWTLTSRVSDASGKPTMIDGLEYADAHVSTAVPWSVTTGIDSYQFAAVEPAPAPVMHVQRSEPKGVPRSDEPNNQYWQLGSVELPFVATWTVTIWRP